MADTSKPLDVLVVGELNIDLVLLDVPMPVYEQEQLAGDMRFAMGSSSAITAHNLSMIGSHVGFLGKAGQDPFGDFMIAGLQSAGVVTDPVIRSADLKTGATVVIANPPQKALLTYMGAMSELRLEDIDPAILGSARHLHLGCFFLQPGIRPDVGKLFRKAREMGLTTSLDTNWDPDDVWGEDLSLALDHTDIFFPNEDEARRIAGSDDLETAMERLKDRVPVLAVKCGGDGSVLWADDQRWTHPGFRTTVKETTGAGDSFNAGFLHRYLRGGSWEECLDFGNRCGALAVTEMGGTGAFRDRETLHHQLNGMDLR